MTARPNSTIDYSKLTSTELVDLLIYLVDTTAHSWSARIAEIARRDGVNVEEAKAEVLRRLSTKADASRQTHSCDIPGCVSCGNPPDDYEYNYSPDDYDCSIVDDPESEFD